MSNTAATGPHLAGQLRAAQLVVPTSTAAIVPLPQRGSRLRAVPAWAAR